MAYVSCSWMRWKASVRSWMEAAVVRVAAFEVMSKVVTLLGVVWMVLHYMCISVQCGDFSNSFGYVIVVLRFFTITGKHVRQSVSRLALSVHYSDLTVLLLQCFLCSFT